MAIVNNGKVTFGSQYDFDSAIKELADLVGVSTRSDGKLHLADLFWGNINKWSKNKPFLSNVLHFATDTDRDQARREAMYGLAVDVQSHETNDNVFYALWKPADLTGSWKRIRDFDGYNHSATGGIEIRNKSLYSAFNSSTNILLKTETPSNDGVALEDILEFSTIPFKSYQWVLVDSYGFIYGQYGFASYDDLLANLNSGMHYLICDNYLTSLSNWRNNPSKIAPFIPAMTGGKLTVGLAGVSDDMPTSSNPYTKNRRLLLNSLELTDSRVNQMGLSMTFGVRGYGANMIIGSIYEGKAPLYSKMYGGDLLNCCTDDCIFMGFQLYQNLQDTVTYNLSTYLEINVYVNGTPYYSRIPYYNGETLASDFSVVKGQTYGSKGENNGNAWSVGCFYFTTRGLFEMFPDQTELDIQFSVANYMQSFQSLPFARIKIRNTGKSVSEISAKANYPSSRSIAWYKYQ